MTTIKESEKLTRTVALQQAQSAPETIICSCWCFWGNLGSSSSCLYLGHRRLPPLAGDSTKSNSILRRLRGEGSLSRRTGVSETLPYCHYSNSKTKQLAQSLPLEKSFGDHKQMLRKPRQLSSLSPRWLNCSLLPLSISPFGCTGRLIKIVEKSKPICHTANKLHNVHVDVVTISGRVRIAYTQSFWS